MNRNHPFHDLLKPFGIRDVYKRQVVSGTEENAATVIALFDYLRKTFRRLSEEKYSGYAQGRRGYWRTAKGKKAVSYTHLFMAFQIDLPILSARLRRSSTIRMILSTSPGL